MCNQCANASFYDLKRTKRKVTLHWKQTLLEHLLFSALKTALSYICNLLHNVLMFLAEFICSLKADLQL